MKITQLSFVFVVLLCCACSGGESPPKILSEDQFEAVYIALLDSARVIQSAQADSLVHPVAQRILERHDITPEQFRATVARYNAEPQRWKDFFDRVLKKLEYRRTQRTGN